MYRQSFDTALFLRFYFYKSLLNGSSARASWKGRHLSELRDYGIELLFTLYRRSGPIERGSIVQSEKQNDELGVLELFQAVLEPRRGWKPSSRTLHLNRRWSMLFPASLALRNSLRPTYKLSILIQVNITPLKIILINERHQSCFIPYSSMKLFHYYQKWIIRHDIWITAIILNYINSYCLIFGCQWLCLSWKRRLQTRKDASSHG